MNTPQSIQRRRNQLHKTDITFHTLIITLTHQIQNDKTHNDTSHYVHTHSNLRTKNMADCTFTCDPNVCAYFQKSKPPWYMYTPVWFIVHTSLVHSTYQSCSQTTDTLIRRVSGPRKCAEPVRVKVKVNNDRVALSWYHINNWRTGFVWVELCAYSIIYNSTWTNIEYKCESFHFSYGSLMEESLMIACHVKLWIMQLSWIFFSKNV